jgi:hypothetical protein
MLRFLVRLLGRFAVAVRRPHPVHTHKRLFSVPPLPPSAAKLVGDTVHVCFGLVFAPHWLSIL